MQYCKKTNIKIMTAAKRTRRSPVRHRMEPTQGRPLYSWAEEKLSNDDYFPFLYFCRERDSSLTETHVISQATFEYLQSEFENRSRLEP